MPGPGVHHSNCGIVKTVGGALYDIVYRTAHSYLWRYLKAGHAALPIVNRNTEVHVEFKLKKNNKKENQ